MHLLESVVPWTITQYFTLYFWRSSSTSAQDFHPSRWTSHSILTYEAVFLLCLRFLSKRLSHDTAPCISRGISDEMYHCRVHNLNAIARISMTRTAQVGQEGEGSRRPSPTSRTTRRPSAYKKRPPNLDRYTCDMALNIVARKVEIS